MGMGMGMETDSNTGAPPASPSALRNLPSVTVAPQHLVDPSNRECCICFHDYSLGDSVSRLPCGHFFHPGCVKSWLEKHCTCPICRYELETDVEWYEKGRKERMAGRRPRFRRNELERMPVRELRSLAHESLLPPPQETEGRGRGNSGSSGARPSSAPASTPTVDYAAKYALDRELRFMEKSDLVSRIINSGKIEVIPCKVDPVPHRLSALRAMSVTQLRGCMMDAAVDFDPKRDRGVVEKSDMVDIFVKSGRLVLLPEEDCGGESSSASSPLGDEDHKPAAIVKGAAQEVASATGEEKTRPELNRPRSDFSSYDLSELRSHAEWLGIDISDCDGRAAVVRKLDRETSTAAGSTRSLPSLSSQREESDATVGRGRTARRSLSADKTRERSRSRSS